MKRAVTIVVFIMFMSLSLFGQNMQMAEGTYYRVFSESGKEDAQEKAQFLDAFFVLFNSYFHFNPEVLEYKMNVRLFADKDNFDAYLDAAVSETRDTYVFLQYRDPSKSELVGFALDDGETERRALIHHGFVQYLRNFVFEPPLWLQKGFAIYFEESIYNSEKKSAVFRENMSWVPYLRTLLAMEAKEEGSSGLIPLNNLLYLDADTANENIDQFYAESWGMVSFLLNSNYKSYNRVLWDAISALQREADKRNNETATVRRAFEWTDRNLFVNDFASYVSSIKTFPDLVEAGMNAYGMERYKEAEEAFINAMTLRPDNYVPYYYLGLIAYAGGDYASAEYYYHSSIQVGGNAPLAYYALGVNAYADNRKSDATFYLNQVKSLDPDGFGARADTLLTRIETEG
jgi:tetratricopeptide (TPR) repeat protein